MPRPGCRHPMSSCCWWLRPACCSASGCSRCRPRPGPVGMLCIHAAIIRNCKQLPRRAALARRHAQMAHPVRAARPALRPVLDRDPAAPGGPRRRLEHDDDVPDAAGDRGVEHAGGQPADCGAGGDRAGDGGDRAQFRAGRHLRQLRARAARASPPKAISPCSPIGCIRRRWRRWKRAPKRTR